MKFLLSQLTKGYIITPPTFLSYVVGLIRRFKNQNILILIFVLLLSSFLYGGDGFFQILGGERAGTSVFTFLKIRVGARVAGMANAGVSLSEDATSLYWNPAAAAQIGKKNNLTVSHTRWPAEIEYSYMGYIQQVSTNIFFGLSAGALYTDPMEITTEYQPYGTGEYFNYGDLFLGFTYSMKMTDRFSYGITLKYVEETLADLSMNNVLMDLGTYYWTGFKTLRFCVSLVNFGTQSRPGGTYTKPLKEGGEKAEKYTLFSPPTEFRIGSAIDLFESSNYKTMLSIQLNHPVDNAENFVFGVEESIFGRFFIRTGEIFNQEDRSFAVGGGVRLPIGSLEFSADYSWSDFSVLGDIQKIQIAIRFK